MVKLEKEAKIEQEKIQVETDKLNPEIKILENITPDQIKSIDNILNYDLNGNIIIEPITSSKIKSAVPSLNNLQIQTVISMINKNINSLPEIDKKVNAISTLTPIIKSESEKIDETGRNTVLGKVLSFVEGKVEARAQWRGCGSFTTYNWWGTDYNFSPCAAANATRELRDLANKIDYLYIADRFEWGS